MPAVDASAGHRLLSAMTFLNERLHRSGKGMIAMLCHQIEEKIDCKHTFSSKQWNSLFIPNIILIKQNFFFQSIICFYINFSFDSL